MTSEVVIMNKHGLSLAADSAITSGRDGIQKVYNSANKLFSLSRDHSVGLMVYGAASFMEVPWGVVIKSYRDQLNETPFANLNDYIEDFLNYICQDDRINQQDVEDIIVYRTFSDVLKRLVNEVELIIDEKEREGVNVLYENVTNWLMECVHDQIEVFRKKKKVFLDIDKAKFSNLFKSVIEEVRDEFITYEVPPTIDDLLVELAFQVTVKDSFSNGSSGLVIVGYGEREIFPHLINLRLEGFVCGQLKYKQLLEKKISYKSGQEDGTASITAFAQREMVDSFMRGIEPSMEDAVFNIIDKVLEGYDHQIQEHLNIDFTTEQVKDLKNLGNEMYDSIKKSVEEYQQSNYIDPLLGIVRSLPTEELAEMTEALVNLTSFKRRVTRATESVGPPIDVAIITKGDGFVWVKRKNYINPEINSRF